MFANQKIDMLLSAIFFKTSNTKSGMALETVKTGDKGNLDVEITYVRTRIGTWLTTHVVAFSLAWTASSIYWNFKIDNIQQTNTVVTRDLNTTIKGLSDKLSMEQSFKDQMMLKNFIDSAAAVREQQFEELKKMLHK